MQRPAGVPESFAYYRNHDQPQYHGMARAARLRTGGRLELTPDQIAGLGRDRMRGDELSDAFVEACFATGSVRHLRGWVETVLDHGTGAIPEEAPVELAHLVEHLDAEPDWLDWERVERGARVFRSYGVDAFLYFGVMGIDGYRRESIHKPLVLTGAYTGGSAFGRFLETCRFWTDVSEPGALRPGQTGRRTATLVRVMHSMIRHHLTPHPEWDGERLGMPLNQLDQLGTIVFSFVLSQHLRLLGYWPSQREVEDHMHFWRYVAYLLGIEPAFMPASEADWIRLTYLAYVGAEPADCEDSRKLSRDMIAAFAPTGTESPARRAAKEAELRTAEEYAAYFVFPAAMEAAGIASLGWRRWRPARAIVPNTARTVRRRFSPRYAERLDARQRAARAEWLGTHLDGATAAFTPVDRLTR